jgi:hypothetical protein
MGTKIQQPDSPPALPETKPDIKRPYRPPRLRRLGSVAELTLGTGFTTSEKGGFKSAG